MPEPGRDAPNQYDARDLCRRFPAVRLVVVVCLTHDDRVMGASWGTSDASGHWKANCDLAGAMMRECCEVVTELAEEVEA